MINFTPDVCDAPAERIVGGVGLLEEPMWIGRDYVTRGKNALTTFKSTAPVCNV